ncbi:MAG: hypothetical protein ACRED5_01200 [Propylenella sp.]
MLSIRRHRGPQAFQEESAFGRPEPGWPGWGELGPILLRSAGIAGIAGVIMVIVAGDVLFTEPLRTPRKETQAFVAPAKEVPAAIELEATEPAAAEPAAVELEAAEPAVAEPAAVELVAVEPAAAAEARAAAVAKVFDRRAPAAETRSPAEAFAFAAAPDMPPSKPAAVRLELRGNLSPEDSAEPEVSPPAVESEGVVAAASAVPDPDAEKVPVAVADPIAAEPMEDWEAALSVADPIEAVAAPPFTAALRGTDVAALSAAAPAEDDAPAAAAGGTAPWAEEALVCPRDWLEMSGTAHADEIPDGCGPKFVLVAPVPSAATEAPEEPTLDETLESAAATHALKLMGFVARLPIPRPDPPPVRRVSRNQNADWPASPPPNCGDKHAYWRFVDRKAGTKEWYCR